VATQAHAADLPSAAVAAAASNVPEGYSVSLEGGIINAPGESVDKLSFGGSGGPALSLGNNYGGEAAISIQKQITPDWDIQGSVGVVRLQHNGGTFDFDGGANSGGSTAVVGTDFGMETIDFDAGYTPSLDGNFKVRLFAGLRGLHYSDTQEQTDYSGGGFPPPSIGESTKNDFFGLGPRIGVEGSTRFGDSNFGISGSLAGAVIFGQNSNKVDFTIFGTPDGSFDARAGKTVYDLAGSLGLDYYLTDTSTLTVGYKGEELWNVRGGEASVSGGPASTNQFLGTAFLKLKATY
jgi:hypothetical protein